MAVCLLWLLGNLPGAVEIGAITGTVDRPDTVKALVAVNRATEKKYAGKVDPATGKFTIADLPAGAKYDLLVDYTGGRLEGVDLTAPAADDREPLTSEDVEALKARVRELNQFEDTVEVMAVRGNGRHAAVLLNKLRTRPFVNSAPGEIIWRVELWHFEKPDETWIKSQDELFLVLYRERLQKSAFEKKAITFDPALGGLAVAGGANTIVPGAIKLPGPEPRIRIRGQGEKP